MMIESQLGPAASTKTRTDALLWAFWSLQIFPRFFRIGKGEEILLFGHTLKLIVAHSGLEWTKTGKVSHWSGRMKMRKKFPMSNFVFLSTLTTKMAESPTLALRLLVNMTPGFNQEGFVI